MPATSLPSLPSLKARISWARAKEGISYEALSRRMEHPVNWLILRQLEQGQADRSTPELLADLAKALNVDQRWLLEQEKHPEKPQAVLTTTTTATAPRILPAKPESVAEERKPQQSVVWNPAAAASGTAKPGQMKPVEADTLGAKVRAERLARGLSQSKLAQLVQDANPSHRLSDTTVSYVEHNTHKGMVRAETVGALLAYLGLDASDPDSAFSPPSAPSPITHLHTVSGAGARVKRLREKLGLSQERLGVKIGIYQTAISRIERDLETAPINVGMLAFALQTTPDYLLNGDGLEPVTPTPAKGVIPGLGKALTALAKADRELNRETRAAGPTGGVAATGATGAVTAPTTAREAETIAPEGEVIRPRQVDQVRTVADKTGIYLFCSRRGFRRKGSVLTPVSESVVNVAFSVETAEAIIEDLRDAVKQTRDLRR